ncbi:MAG: hypothetical protein KHY76_03340 [Butyricicoccus pullicaecorum]|nr:hypothetical protein [Butyricicoccus pullicaecorum]
MCNALDCSFEDIMETVDLEK